MDLIWTALFIALWAGTGGLLYACDQWLAPRGKALR